MQQNLGSVVSTCIAPPARRSYGILAHPGRLVDFSPPLGPRPLITVEVGRKQQFRDDLFINADADVQVQSSQVGRWMITDNRL